MAKANDLRPRVTAAARSDKGRVRPDNQDNYIIMPLEVREPADANAPSALITSADTRYVIGNRGILLGVFDGMGGVAGGQWAAGESSRFVGRTLFDRRREVGSEGKPGDKPEKILESVLHSANERIHKYGYEKPEWMGMGSTATTAWIVGRRLVIGQVGDSRAYLLHDGKLTQLTRDQTLVNALVEAGVLSEAQAAVHPRRSELLECLGPSPDVRPELFEVTLPAKSRLLLCSDGLHGPIASQDAIRDILAQTRLPGEACKLLVDAANAKGGPDNITTIVADLDIPGGAEKPVVRRLTPKDALLGYLDAPGETESTPAPAPKAGDDVMELQPWQEGEPTDADEEVDEENEEVAGSGGPGLLMWVMVGLLLAGVGVLGVMVFQEYQRRQAESAKQLAPATPHHDDTGKTGDAGEPKNKIEQPSSPAAVAKDPEPKETKVKDSEPKDPAPKPE